MESLLVLALRLLELLLKQVFLTVVHLYCVLLHRLLVVTLLRLEPRFDRILVGCQLVRLVLWLVNLPWHDAHRLLLPAREVVLGAEFDDLDRGVAKLCVKPPSIRILKGA